MKHLKAFTLTELLVVIAIVIILGAIGFSVIKFNNNDFAEQATRNKMDVVDQKIKEYKLQHGTYPLSLDTDVQ